MSARGYRGYSGCPCCGSTKTETTVAPVEGQPDKERLIVNCAGCGNRRSNYIRRKKASAA